MTILTPTGVFEAGIQRSMKRALFAIAIMVAAALAGGPAAAGWDASGALLLAQAQKGRPGQGPGPERNDRAREPRQNRPEERRERMTEDQRQSLHRDLDKANRELYGRQPKK
jgi:hypothetical protein